MAVIPLREHQAASHAASYDAPFGLLEACHDRMAHYLALMRRLCLHLETGSGPVDQAAQEAARDIRRYFNVAAPLHHEDEERHVFAPLLATPDLGLQQAVRRLQADHLDFARRWSELDPLLHAVEHGKLPALALEAIAQQVQELALAYAAHIECEQTLIFPAALQLFSLQGEAGQQVLREMGAEMAQRRGVRPTAP